MPDISFSSFNSRSFEQFSQALAAGVLGPGLMVFGDGPDGGREATFVGMVPYPGKEERWSGRLLMQAKFKQRPLQDYRDADWLVEQLEAEADKLAGTDRVPDYYILVTNLRLSGVAGKERKGGQQKLDDAFERRLRPLGVKALHVWHEEKIATLLDGLPQLLRSYGAWLSPREVLAAAFEVLSDRVPDFGSTMLRFLQRELRDQRATRLQQAGHVDDAPTPLESVFVDLPYGVNVDQAHGWHQLERAMLGEESMTGNLLRDLLALLSTKLDPATLALTWPQTDGPPPARHLVLGGPGQGKSTITQFLAQVARARLLTDQPEHLLTPDARPAVRAIRHRMEELGLPLEGVRRYPMRVDLPSFADALARSASGDAPLSLLEFLAHRVATAATAPAVDVSVLRRWLAEYPWLIILDGLDEVPSSGNRADVLAAIAAFWDEATPLNADVAMVVTTRPQGYNDDLDPCLHLRHEMVRLDTTRALEYAGRVALLKIGDEERRATVVERLAAAASNPTTALLMVSPLQVAILLHLVDQGGSAPTDRWTLFDEYRSIVVKRELDKHGTAGRVIREQRLVIDGLLRRAGLLLHLESEKRGGAEAFLTLERFRELALDVLREMGHEGAELERLAVEITGAITNRLVFLEQRTEGRVEFDVRSLQEFMAAAELMEGADDRVADRLHTIAGPTHWRHVYRIAASKAFSVRDATKYRDAIITANTQAEAVGAGPRATRRAGRLALELLADGVAHDQPRYFRLLLDQAMSTLNLNQLAPDPRLVDAIMAGGGASASPLLVPRLSSRDDPLRRGAWRLLLACVRTKDDWADRLVVEHWPVDPLERVQIATAGVQPVAQSAAEKLVGAAVDHARPPLVSKALSIATRRGRNELDLGLMTRRPILAAFGMSRSRATLDIGVLQKVSPQMRLRVIPLDGARRSGLLERPRTSEWQTLDTLRAFVDEPSTERLAAHALSLTNADVLDAAQRVVAPWMAATATALVSNGADPVSLSAEIASGNFGQPDTWASAEQRWQVQGTTERDLDLWRRGVFFGADIADVGAPYASYLSMSLGSPQSWGRELKLLIAALGDAPESAPAEQMRRIISFALTEPWLDGQLTAAEYCKVVLAPGPVERLIGTSQIAAIRPEDRHDRELLDRLARLGRQGRFLVGPENPRVDVRTIADMVRALDDMGLLTFACAIFAAAPAQLRGVAHDLSDVVAAALESSTPPPSAFVLGFAAGAVPVAEAINASLAGKVETMEQHALLALADETSVEAELILSSLVERCSAEAINLHEEALAGLDRLLDSRGSGLEDATVWSRLGLPMRLREMLKPSGE